MRIISLDGRLGADAELKQTKGGKPYVRFSVANNYFADGKEVTDWFDVNCYDPFVIDHKINFLKKGRYVIVTGNIRTEVSNRNGKLWLSHYVTATNVDTPSFGKSKDEGGEAQPTLSVYTGGTRSDLTQQAPATAPVAAAPATIDVPTYEPQVDDGYNGDDLPF